MNRMKSVLLVSGLVCVISPTIALAQSEQAQLGPGLERLQRLFKTEPPEFCSVVASGLSKTVAPLINVSKWQRWPSKSLFQIDLLTTKLNDKLGQCVLMDMKAGKLDSAFDDLVARSTVEELLITISKAELIATWREDDEVVTRMHRSAQVFQPGCSQQYDDITRTINEQQRQAEQAAKEWETFEAGVAAGSLNPVSH